MNKLLKFLFPAPTIFITLVFFVLFRITGNLDSALSNTFTFFIMAMIPFDLIIWIINKIAHILQPSKTDKVYNTPQSSDSQNYEYHRQQNYKEIENFASLCVASCEFDKEQNYIDEATNGNVRYNDKRFDNVIDDPVVLATVSQPKIKEYSDHITKLCDSLGAKIWISGVSCTKMYVILKAIPSPGVRIRSILALQNDIEISIGMSTVMNVMEKKGYIGILLPIQHFVESDFRDTQSRSFFESTQQNDTANQITNIDSMNGYEFEHFCAKVLQINGFCNINVTKASSDQGVDIIALKDGIRCAVQCKRYSNNVGNKAVQEVIAGMQYYNCSIGIVMTNNYFTQSAKELANRAEIILWDRNFLLKYALPQQRIPPELQAKGEKILQDMANIYISLFQDIMHVNVVLVNARFKGEDTELIYRCDTNEQAKYIVSQQEFLSGKLHRQQYFTELSNNCFSVIVKD